MKAIHAWATFAMIPPYMGSCMQPVSTRPECTPTPTHAHAHTHAHVIAEKSFVTILKHY